MTNLSSLPGATQASNAKSALLNDFRAERLQKLDNLFLPGRKTEHWKYSAKRLNQLQEMKLSAREVNTQTSQRHPAYALECYELYLVDGVVQEASLPEGLSATNFDALNDAQAKEVLSGAIASSEDLDMSELNHAHHRAGVFLEVAANSVLDRPLRIHIVQQDAGVSYPRIFLKLGANAQATVIEEILVPDLESQSFSNIVFDASLEANSHLGLIRMDMHRSATARSIEASGFTLKRDARLNTYCLGLGSALGRHDLRVRMIEPGAECDLNGVTLTQNNEHYDNHTCIEHVAAHCQSNENYRCIADDTSQIVFNGRIHIHKDAQKTLGEMSNKNLLLSSSAEIDSKPELEIYADDVKCAHGTTIGQLDPKEVYYLKTRGIPEKQARQMLTLGFVLQIVRAVPIESLATFWEETLSDILSYEA